MKPILSTPEAVEHLAGPHVPGERRVFGVDKLLELAKAGEVPVWQWNGTQPLFSRHQLDEWVRTRSAA